MNIVFQKDILLLKIFQNDIELFGAQKSLWHLKDLLDVAQKDLDDEIEYLDTLIRILRTPIQMLGEWPDSNFLIINLNNKFLKIISL